MKSERNKTQNYILQELNLGSKKKKLKTHLYVSKMFPKRPEGKTYKNTAVFGLEWLDYEWFLYSSLYSGDPNCFAMNMSFLMRCKKIYIIMFFKQLKILKAMKNWENVKQPR